MGPRRQAIRALALTAVAIVTALGLVACGDDEPEGIDPRVKNATFADEVTGPERAPALAAQRYIIATNTGDGEGICQLTSTNQKELGSCRETVGKSFKAFGQVEYELLSVKIGPPGEAEVRLRQTKPKLKPGDPQTTLFKLIEVDGEWKVNVFTAI